MAREKTDGTKSAMGRKEPDRDGGTGGRVNMKGMSYVNDMERV